MINMERYLQFKIILVFQVFLILSLFFAGYLVTAKVSNVIDDSFEFKKMNNGETNG